MTLLTSPPGSLESPLGQEKPRKESPRALVADVHSHDEGSPLGCRSPQPSMDAAGGTDSATHGGGLHVPSVGTAGAQESRSDCSRGNGCRRWSGNLHAGAAAD